MADGAIDIVGANGSKRHPTQIPPSPPTTAVQTSRDQLISALMLRQDPFRHKVTDQEIELNFGEIYVDPEESLLSPLLEPSSAFVFAKFGMGKTATRLALEYALRLTPGIEGTLAVRYDPNRDVGQWGNTKLHFNRLLQDMAIDLVIQTFERHNNSLHPLSNACIEALERQVMMLPQWLRNQIQKHAQQPTANGAFWGTIRPVVESMGISPRWHELMTILVRGTKRRGRQRQPTLALALEDAHTLGFHDIFLLIDGVDDTSIDPHRWLMFLAPLLERLPTLQSQHLFLKCFLPAAAHEVLLAEYAVLLRGLTPTPVVTTMNHMSDSDLRRILRDRIKASKSVPAHIVHLDFLAESDISESIEEWLVTQANGSPRRVLALASNLLDFHATYGFQDRRRLHLTADEWAIFKQQNSDERVFPDS